MKSFKQFLTEKESPFNVEQPLSHGGPSEDPNTRHISSTTPITGEETPASAYANDYYISVLNWWLAAYPLLGHTEMGRLFIEAWRFMANNWYYPRTTTVPDILSPDPKDVLLISPREIFEMRNRLLAWNRDYFRLPLPEDFYDNKFSFTPDIQMNVEVEDRNGPVNR